ncbi:rhodanese-like domain-containing protein [Mycolicibacterium vaccae]|uniref:Rhodanese domain-containing protein n=1 Tax=Mycolicibacterium vaccae ATCC 25954 TaxID=1194972 RepID=K0USK8_MYCVA|nr:rhodanese-like domain-containing protein [Mycolicibacterium vaccae]ANI37558.1 sulfurtransferase [Mycolicibacterium vaccae 95051]EJZ05593.1 rhodanese domain-containing protein [Mycolicibacterium vaccae ATCC 25954]MCV7059602.1 sulfurtransferase [Mycolicibacterium vaccae]
MTEPGADARAFFTARLAYEIDAADLVLARATTSPPIVVDTRSLAAWDQGHLPAARHLPGPELRDRARTELPDLDADIVVYCWGPGCNGATKAAHTLSDMGYRRVRELLGGFEYWAREGLAVVTPRGRIRRGPDDLTAVTALPQEPGVRSG